MSDLPFALRNIVLIGVCMALLFAFVVAVVLIRRDRVKHTRRVDDLLQREILIPQDAWPPRRCQTCWHMFWMLDAHSTPYAACAVSADKRSHCLVESAPLGACGRCAINRLPKE